jgi:RNase H-like domain found in reverse transcriptase
VLNCLWDHHLYTNPAKCEWDKSKVEYLDYIIGADGIKMNPKKLDTILSWPEPTSIKELQSFLGFSNFYHHFIDAYCCITIPLSILTEKGTSFSFSDLAHLAFNELKHCFTTAPILQHFNPQKPCTLSTDASDFVLSGVLQKSDENGNLHPVAFYSHKFSPAEIDYDIHNKELLSIVECFCDMHAWLMGSPWPISVISDHHHNLLYFMSSQVLNHCQVHWEMFLSEFNFKLIWGPGVENVADGPSHCPDFIPKKGDDVLLGQHQLVLTPLTYPTASFLSRIFIY